MKYNPFAVVVTVVLAVGLLVFAYSAGRISGYYSQVRSSNTVRADSPLTAEQQQMEDAAGIAGRVEELEKEEKALKKEVADLKSDKADLQNKLSIAADTVNKLQISLHEAQRKAEDAEWRAKQGSGPPVGSPIP